MTNTVMPRIKSDGLIDWLLVVDLDEFMYAPSINETIASVLANTMPEESLVCVPWSMYGTSGLIKQPPCIVPFFLKRAPKQPRDILPVKCAVRVENLTQIGVHFHRTASNQFAYVPKTAFFRSVYLTTKGNAMIRQPKYIMNEDNIGQWPLRINHYQMQSEEHFNRKRTKDSMRQITPVHTWDSDHSIVDDDLARKMHWKRPNVPLCGPKGW